MNDEYNFISNIPLDLKVHLDILAKENHTNLENLVVNILTEHVRSEFSNYDDTVIED